MIGRVLCAKENNGFRVDRLIRENETRRIYAGVALPSGRPIAIHMPAETLESNANGIARSLNEARCGSRLCGAHGMRVIDVGRETDGTMFMISEPLDGVWLSDLVARGSSEQQVIAWALQALEVLTEIHELDMVHRNVKPAHMVIVRRPSANEECLLLVGLALVRPNGELVRDRDGVFGTPAYMAPEQWADPHGVDGRADLWSLGVSMYELVTGRLPFAGTREQVCHAIMTDVPEPIGSARLDPIVGRCLEKDSARRWSSARELAAALTA